MRCASTSLCSHCTGWMRARASVETEREARTHRGAGDAATWRSGGRREAAEGWNAKRREDTRLRVATMWRRCEALSASSNAQCDATLLDGYAARVGSLLLLRFDGWLEVHLADSGHAREEARRGQRGGSGVVEERVGGGDDAMRCDAWPSALQL